MISGVQICDFGLARLADPDHDHSLMISMIQICDFGLAQLADPDHDQSFFMIFCDSRFVTLV
jgi:hypothetical protein